MDKVQYRNRYGDIFTFSKTEDGDLLWEGNFEWCRCGWPNVYDDAFKAYNEDGGDMSLEEFKDKVHEYNYDNSTWTMDTKYQKLIYSDRNTIDMLDTSGGPYIHSGYDMGMFDKSLEGMIVEKFERTDNDNAWKIIVKK